MFFQYALFGLVAVASAQDTKYTSSTTSSTTSTSVPATTHTIAVGAIGFKFEPNKLTANVGDIIEFNFYPGGHSVVRGGFKSPCIPYEVTGVNRVGFFSGYQDSKVYTDNGPKFRVRVNNTEPIFYYCSAPGSCVDHHMVGVINPNSTWTLEAQEEVVKKADFQLEPGQPLPKESASPKIPTSVAGSPYGASPSASPKPEANGLTAGPIAGIAIGSIAVLVLAGVLIYLCGRLGKAKAMALLPFHRKSNSSDSDVNSFVASRAMLDSKAGIGGVPSSGKGFTGTPKSPGQNTFSTVNSTYPAANAASLVDSYNRAGNVSPPVYGQQPSYTSPPVVSPQAVSPGTYGAYNPAAYHNIGIYPAVSAVQSPNQPVEICAGPVMVTDERARAFYTQQDSPTRPPPVELPASQDPGNSPLPGYVRDARGERVFSWARGAESGYRPTTKG